MVSLRSPVLFTISRANVHLVRGFDLVLRYNAILRPRKM
jgi:hypothetical protein